MVVGKIISILDISVEVVLNSNDVKVGDILEVDGDANYRFEVVEITNTSAVCISLESTRGLKKGKPVVKISDGCIMTIRIIISIKEIIVTLCNSQTFRYT